MSEIDDLIRLVEEVSGNVVPDRERDRLTAKALERMRQIGVADLAAYVRWLSLDRDSGEWRTLLTQITINESYLFRATQQFASLVDRVLPEILPRRPSRRLRLWSAGCAQGEEAATLAIVLSECASLAGWDWSILATDVDEQALDHARSGLFGDRAVAKVPDEFLGRYFTRKADRYLISPTLRRRIEFRHLNLIRDPIPLDDASVDIILLRNVLIYFRPESQRRVALAMRRIMAEDGYLFLGTSESLWQLCPELEAVDLGQSFCYRRKLAPTDARETVPAPVPPSVRKPIQDRSRAARPNPPQAPPRELPDTAPQSASDTPADSRTALQRKVVDALVASGTAGAEKMLAEAERLFPEDAVLRALRGLILDLSNETEPAIRAYRAALYLDQRLFQVRLLLARCIERMGWQDRARLEYDRVLGFLAVGEPRALPGSADLGLPTVDEVRARCRANR